METDFHFQETIKSAERERSVSNLFEPQGKAGVKKFSFYKKFLE
jgi:hypothetical protein